MNHEGKNIVFFDGVCNLCNGFINFLVSRDKTRQFYIASLQGETAQNVLDANDIQSLSSVILYSKDGKKYYQSTAVLKILTQLNTFYKIFYLGFILPRFLRDILYNFVAKNRYRFFGKKEFCRLPTAEEGSFFLP